MEEEIESVARHTCSLSKKIMKGTGKSLIFTNTSDAGTRGASLSIMQSEIRPSVRFLPPVQMLLIDN